MVSANTSSRWSKMCIRDRCKSVDRSAAENGGSTWKNVLSGVFMLVMFLVYIPILLFTDNVHEQTHQMCIRDSRKGV